MSVVVGECDGEGVGDDGSSLRPRIGDYFASLFDVLFSKKFFLIPKMIYFFVLLFKVLKTILTNA